LWRHSLASGAFGKEVARARRVNVESAYLCGLLHGIGKPVVLRTVATLARQQQLTLDKPRLHALIDGYHGRVGGLIADKWGLPKQVIEAILYYMDYDHASAFRQECMLTCVADRLATFLLAPEDLPEENLRDHPVFAELNLYPGDIDQLIAGKEKVLAVVNALNL
jgi:HD-like signal output (HDOD) protein